MQNWHFQRSEGSSILCHIAAISGLYNTLTLISDHSYHCIDATCNNQNGHKLRCSELISGTKALQFVTFAGQRLWALLLVNCIMGGVFNEAAWRKIYFSRCFLWILAWDQHWEVFVLLLCKFYSKTLVTDEKETQFKWIQLKRCWISNYASFLNESTYCLFQNRSCFVDI